MTLKPPRTQFEAEPEEQRIRYLKREQEEKEARRSLRDYLRHMKEEEDDKYAPPNPI